MATTPVLGNDLYFLDLQFVQGDPYDNSFRFVGLDYSGDYVAQIREQASPTSTLLATLTVTATLDGDDTVIRLQLDAEDNDLPPTTPSRRWRWDLQQVGGTTLMRGSVAVFGEVTSV